MDINITNVFDEFDLSITNCDISDIVTEVSRFMYHILLVHLITYAIDKKDELFGSQVFKTLFITAFAVMMYHIFFKKFMNTKLKNIQSVCNSDKEYTNIKDKSNNNEQK